MRTKLPTAVLPARGSKVLPSGAPLPLPVAAKFINGAGGGGGGTTMLLPVRPPTAAVVAATDGIDNDAAESDDMVAANEALPLPAPIIGGTGGGGCGIAGGHGMARVDGGYDDGGG